MAANFSELSICKASEPANKLLLVDFDSSQQTEAECNHFSIRGYVAAIHQSDRKICWPFASLHTECELKDQNLLPPLAVAEFRWWNCEKCLLKCSGIERTGLTDLSQNKEPGKAITDISLDMEMDGNMQKHMVSYPVAESDIFLAEVTPILEDRKSVHDMGKVNATEEGGLSNSGEKNLQHSEKVLEAMFIEQYQTAEQQNSQMSNPLDELNRCHFLYKSTFTQRDNMIDGIHDESASLGFQILPKSCEINCELGSEKLAKDGENFCRNEHQSPTGANTSGQNVRAKKSDGIQVSELSSGGSEHKHLQGTRKNDIIVECEEEEHVDVLGIFDHRRVRKTRMLSDIINSEMPGISNMSFEASEEEVVHVDDINKEKNDISNDVKPTCKKQTKIGSIPATSKGKVADLAVKRNRKTDSGKEEREHMSEKPGESIPTSAIYEDQSTHVYDKNSGWTDNLNKEFKKACRKNCMPKVASEIIEVHAINDNNRNNEKTDNLKGESKHGSKKHGIIAKEIQKTKIKHKKRLELLDAEDESSFLIHWMVRSSKKFEACKQGGSSKQFNSMKMHSNSPKTVSHILPSRKNVRPFLDGNQAEDSNLKMQKSSFEVGHQRFLQQTPNVKDYLSTSAGGGCKNKFGNEHCKATMMAFTENSVLPNPPSLDSQSEKAVANNPYEETSLAKVNRKSPMAQKKDSDWLCKDKISKKQIARKRERISGSTSVDGIPVEILKLLQENWQKRHPVESSNVKRSGSTSKDTRNGKGLNCMIASTKNVHELPTEPYMQQPQQESTVRTANEAPIDPSACQPHPVPLSVTCSLEKELIYARNHPEIAAYVNPGVQNAYEQRNKLEAGYQVNGKCKSYIHHGEQLNISKMAGNGLHSFSTSINVVECGHQDVDQHWFMDGSRICTGDHHIPCRISNGDYCECQTPLGKMKFGIRDSWNQNIPVNSKGKEVVLKDYLLKRKREFMDAECRKAVDQPVAQLHKQKKAINQQSYKDIPYANGLSYLRAQREWCAGTTQPLNLGTDKTFSAQNLLRLMDPTVYSTTPLSVSTDKSISKFSNQSNFSYGFQPEGFFRPSFRDRSELENKDRKMQENVNQHHPLVSSVSLNSPAQNAEVSVPFHLREAVAYPPSHDPRTFHPFKGVDNGRDHYYLDRSASISGYPSVSQTRVAPFYSFLCNGDQEASTSFQSRINSFCGKTVHVEQRKKVETQQNGKHSSPTELCVVNRNPSDFTIPGEENEYMTGYEDLQPRLCPLPKGRDCHIHPIHQRK